MTLDEITDAIESYTRRKERELQERAAMDYRLAALVGRAVSCAMVGGKFPEPAEVYPGILEPAKPQAQDWRVAKERLLQYSAAHNRKRHQGGDSN